MASTCPPLRSPLLIRTSKIAIRLQGRIVLVNQGDRTIALVHPVENVTETRGVVAPVTMSTAD